MATLARRPRKRGPFRCEDCGTEDAALAQSSRAKVCAGCWRVRKNDANKRWHAGHRAENNAKSTARYQANAPAICAATRDACRAYARRRRVENPEAVRAASRRWVEANPGRAAAITRAWARAHPEFFRRAAKVRRARLRGAATTLTDVQWVAIVTAFNGACAYCLRTDRPVTQDHMVPISRGGPHSAENVIPACGSCNSSKGNRRMFTMLG